MSNDEKGKDVKPAGQSPVIDSFPVPPGCIKKFWRLNDKAAKSAVGKYKLWCYIDRLSGGRIISNPASRWTVSGGILNPRLDRLQ